MFTFGSDILLRDLGWACPDGGDLPEGLFGVLAAGQCLALRGPDAVVAVVGEAGW
jgi:hypothetical protein